jgi:predicted AlkP superfamily phosphohydrolase/phosphomutase
LDGTTWTVLKPWIEDGKLPTMKLLMENGVWGDLETVIRELKLKLKNKLTGRL